MTDSTQRRTISELDISSMRRIGDALLLAQNRARRATDRANQTEQCVLCISPSFATLNLPTVLFIWDAACYTLCWLKWMSHDSVSTH